jgi:L-lactate dehydrogenase complex protein LldG
MKQTTAKEQVLKGIRNALMHKRENPFFDITMEEHVYAPVDPVGEVAFAEALTAAGGHFIYCVDEREMLIQMLGLMQQRGWEGISTLNPNFVELLGLANIPVFSNPSKLPDMVVGLTACEALIARLGSVLISSEVSDGRRMFVYPEVHLVMAYATQVVPDIKEALAGLRTRYGDRLPSMVTIVTGPSRTADIEKTLVMGAHGPKELIVFLVDDNIELE